MDIQSSFVVVNKELLSNVVPVTDTIWADLVGSSVIVPKGTWHTPKVHAPTSMLFVTPGQGTENLEHPPERQRA